MDEQSVMVLETQSKHENSHEALATSSNAGTPMTTKLFSGERGSDTDAFPSVNSFVAPFPDETPFSMLSRYFVLYAPCPATLLVNHFFGGANRKIAGPLPTGLDRFYYMMASGFWDNFEDFLERHTHLPYYRPFLSSRMAKKLQGPPGQIKLTSSNLPLAREWASWTDLKFCPSCAREDAESLGQPFWHRAHQIPGILICHKHGIRLLDRCPSCGTVIGHGQRLFLPKLKCECEHKFSDTTLPENLPGSLESPIWRLARFSADLLNTKIKQIDTPILTAFYWNVLRARGYYRPRLEKTRLWHDFEQFYTPGFLKEIGLNLNIRAKTYPLWFEKLTQNSDKSTRQPLHHTLFLSFIFPEFGAFEMALKNFEPADGRKKIANLPAADIRWVPDNPSLGKKLQALLLAKNQGLRGLRSTARELGITYYRADILARSEGVIALLQSKNDAERDAAIIQSLYAGLSCTEVAKKLGVATCYVTRLTSGVPGLVKARRVQRSSAAILEHKARLKQFISENPSINTADFRGQLQFSYVYVHQHDKAWCDEHFPKANRRASTLCSTVKIDLSKRDVEAESKLRSVSGQLRNSLSRPFRLTKCRLLDYAGLKNRVFPYLAQLPGTSKALDEIIDTEESFIRRKIAWALRELSKTDAPISMTAVAQKASLRPKFYHLVDEALAVARDPL